MYRVIEEETGSYTSTPRKHPHNGYYAGDFSSVELTRPDYRAMLPLTRGADFA